MGRKMELMQTDCDRFGKLVLDRSGLYFPHDRQHMLMRGLADALGASSSCTTIDEYYELLRTSPSTDPEWARLVSLLTVGETYFFRHQGHFDALTGAVLPEIVARQQAAGRRIRIWAAGCASGEEPYSIAMLLREQIPNIENWSILILATDINRAAIAKAREGVYGSWSFRGVSKHIQDRYFRVNGDKQYVISDDIKRMVTFSYLNLIEDHYPSLINNTHSMDIILCRNVTIYFSPETTQGVIDRFHECLSEGGWLIPGASEPNMTTYARFEQKNFPGAVIYRKSAMAGTVARPVLVWSVPAATTISPSGFQAARLQPRPGNAITQLPPLPSATAAGRVQPTAPVARKSDPPAERDPYELALELLQVGQVDEALAKLHKKLDQAPNFALAYCLLAKIHANRGELEVAERWCEQALEKDKLLVDAYYILSMIYQEHGALDKALEVLKKTIYLDREFVLAHYNLAHLYRQQGNEALARKSLQNVQRLLADMPKEQILAEGDGLVAGRLLELVGHELIGA